MAYEYKEYFMRTIEDVINIKKELLAADEHTRLKGDLLAEATERTRIRQDPTLNDFYKAFNNALYQAFTAAHYISQYENKKFNDDNLKKDISLKELCAISTETFAIPYILSLQNKKKVLSMINFRSDKQLALWEASMLSERLARKFTLALQEEIRREFYIDQSDEFAEFQASLRKLQRKFAVKPDWIFPKDLFGETESVKIFAYVYVEKVLEYFLYDPTVAHIDLVSENIEESMVYMDIWEHWQHHIRGLLQQKAVEAPQETKSERIAASVPHPVFWQQATLREPTESQNAKATEAASCKL